MALYPITINTAPEVEPHIYAQDDAAIYQSIFGDDCVFDIGSKFKTQTLSNNKIRLSDGVLQNGGHIARIKHGDYEDVTITNGTSGKKRATIIACRFNTTGTIDNMTLFTKDGVAGNTYVDPDLVQNNPYEGGTTREMPLFRVKLDGINIVAVEPMFTLRKNLQGMAGTLTTYPSGDISQILELENGYIKIMGKVDANTMVDDAAASGGVKKDITISSYNIDMTKPYNLSISPEYGQGHPAVSIFKQSDTTIRVLTKQKVSGLLLNWSIEGTKKVK